MKDKSKAELEHAFELMDEEEKGYLTIEDLRRICKDVGEEISEEELQEMIEEADSSRRGRVNKEDFFTFMTSVQDDIFIRNKM